MKLFKFNGGVHPAGHKNATAHKVISVMPPPKHLYVPLQQHIGAPAEIDVLPGQEVLKGQLIGHSQGMVSAPVHAPASGIVTQIIHYPAPHPSGLSVKTVVIETDAEQRTMDYSIPKNPFDLEPEEIYLRVGSAGIVGMGGATFPSSVKLKMGFKRKLKTLIINGGECEPYLTCDDRLMQERPQQIIDGIRLIMHGTQVQETLIAIENNKPKAIAAMRAACTHHADIKVVPIPALYPMGSEKHMIKVVTGKEVPAGGLGADIGVLVHNVGTAYAVHRNFREGRPLISRVVTIGGGAVRHPQNVEVPIGSRLKDVLEFCGGLKEDPARIIMGGPMMGQMMPSLDVPVIKGSSGIIALSEDELAEQASRPCIRCGSCVDACPCGLMPLSMANNIRAEHLEGALEYGLLDCVGCGCCSYVCPSNIPLTQYFNYAKGELTSRQQTKHRMEETRKLVEFKQQRLARIEAEKQAAAEKRKAERLAKKRAQEEAKRKKQAEEAEKATAQA